MRKKKTLYYKAIIRKLGWMVSDGVIIAKVKNNEVIGLEGVFTEDYCNTIVDEKTQTLLLEYYSKDTEYDGKYEKEWQAILRKKPILPFEVELSNSELIIQIISLNQIKEHEQINKCKKRLEQVKNDVFNC